MKRKWFFITIALLCVIYYFSGKPTEIADRVIISAIGIDEIDNSYKVTLQIFTPEGGGSDTSVDPSQPNVQLVSGRGETVDRAITSCLTELGGNIFIGQSQIILFGRNIDFSKENELFDYFLSSADSFVNVDCALADNTAEEILQTPISDATLSSQKFPQTLNSAEENGSCIRMSLINLLNALESPQKAFILPIFSVTAENSAESNSEGSDAQQSEETLSSQKLEVTHGAIILNGKAGSEITNQQMGYTATLNGKSNCISLDVNDGEIVYNKEFSIKSREICVDISDNTIFITYNLNMTSKNNEILQNTSNEKNFNVQIEKKLQTYVNEIYSKHSPEIFNVSDIIKRYCPSIYREYSSNMDLLCENIQLIVNVNCT
ncbi:MAG: hypothetical protein LUI06_03895 [Ruminococcus sp.]|nr:hypothetical protein [Ruminococcus sp.]